MKIFGFEFNFFKKEILIGVDVESVNIFAQNELFGFTINIFADKIDEITFRLPDDFGVKGYFLNDPKEVVKVVEYEDELYVVPSKPLKYNHEDGITRLSEEIKNMTR